MSASHANMVYLCAHREVTLATAMRSEMQQYYFSSGKALRKYMQLFIPSLALA